VIRELPLHDKTTAIKHFVLCLDGTSSRKMGYDVLPPALQQLSIQAEPVLMGQLEKLVPIQS